MKSLWEISPDFAKQLQAEGCEEKMTDGRRYIVVDGCDVPVMTEDEMRARQRSLWIGWDR